MSALSGSSGLEPAEFPRPVIGAVARMISGPGGPFFDACRVIHLLWCVHTIWYSLYPV